MISRTQSRAKSQMAILWSQVTPNLSSSLNQKDCQDRKGVIRMTDTVNKGTTLLLLDNMTEAQKNSRKTLWDHLLSTIQHR
jgi:hypothetical protein